MFVLYKVFTVSMYIYLKNVMQINTDHEVNQIILPNVQRRLLCQQAKGDLSHAVSKLFQKILDKTIFLKQTWGIPRNLVESDCLSFQKEKNENSRNSCIPKNYTPAKITTGTPKN